jgi:hypothetical protein
MKMKLLLVLVVLVLLLSGVSYGGWRLYQRHLSSDLRRTLIAAADPTASDADLQAYLHRARLQVRTERDAEIFGKIATAVQLNDTVRKQVLLNAQRMVDIASRDLNENSACRQMLRLGVKEMMSSRAQVLREQCEKQQAVEKAEQESEQAQQATYQKEMDRARTLFRDFRNELGLP